MSNDISDFSNNLSEQKQQVLQSEEFKQWFGEPQDANRTRDIRTDTQGNGIQGEPTPTDTRGGGISDSENQTVNQYGGSTESISISQSVDQSQDEQGIKGNSYQCNIVIQDDGSPQLWFHGTADDFTDCI